VVVHLRDLLTRRDRLLLAKLSTHSLVISH
jgi:hypothetical protein